MADEKLIRDLETIVGKSNVSTTNIGIELYSYDASLVRGNPGIVVFPANTQEVSQVVKAAKKAKVDFLPRGFGTNLSGGTISVTHGLVICMSRLNKILKICPESRYADLKSGESRRCHTHEPEKGYNGRSQYDTIIRFAGFFSR